MAKIQHVQTVLLDKTLDELKKRTNREFTKDALSDAVDHILVCQEKPMRDALKAAREYIADKAGGVGKAEILKQINKALEEK